MKISKSKVIEYFEYLNNQIDILAEEYLIKPNLSQNEKNNVETLRNKFLNETKKNFELNLNKIKSKEEIAEYDIYDWPFCFLIPNEKKNFKHFGVLVLTNVYVNSNILSYLEHEFVSRDISYDRDVSAKEALIGKFLYFLLNEKFKSPNFDPLIDLTNKVENKIGYFALCSFNVHSINPKDFDLYDILINKECLDQSILNLYVSCLPSRVFLQLDNIKSLDLTFDKKCTLEPDCFVGLKSLEHLQIYDLSIDSIESKCFNGMENLNYLAIIEGKIEKFSDYAFNNLNKLESLVSFSANIEKIESNAFVGLDNLKKLILIDSELIYLPRDVFRNLKNLTTLNLHNSISIQFDAQCLNVLTNLEFLSLYNRYDNDVLNLNKLNLSKLKYLAINSKKVPNFELNLEFLIINGLEEFNNKMFKNLQGLKGLIFETSGSFFWKIKTKMFKYLNNLEHLVISFDELNEKSVYFIENNLEYFADFITKENIYLNYDDSESNCIKISCYDDITKFLKNCIKVGEIAESAINSYHEVYLDHL
ncbi:unnamed protein product [Brachionus calyciflorus]|uniref:Uncharacterized protein n=1 Tax=Brachionus calyciflorus TaxID=104777 RepID=A0A814IN89_9BILA|nr:unnamed protein product [Brachionus calyciflorus]